MNLFGLLSVAFITSLLPHIPFFKLSDYKSESFLLKIDFDTRLGQTAPVGVKPIAAWPRVPRLQPALLTILPHGVVPLAFSLWQRESQHQASRADPSQTIAVQRANRFELNSLTACDRSTAGKQPLKQRAFQVCINDRLVAQFPSQTQAEAMAARLRSLFADGTSSERLQPKLINGLPAGAVDDEVLFIVDLRTAKALQRSSDLIAIDWINQIRTALNAAPLDLAAAQMQLYSLAETSSELSGTASWYGSYFHGRLTAAGEIFNQDDLTAAHPTLPFGTFLKVTNLATGKSVIVRINDRGPYVAERSLDLSREAARCLDSETIGLVSYKAVILQSAIANQPPDRSSPTAIALNSTR